VLMIGALLAPEQRTVALALRVMGLSHENSPDVRGYLGISVPATLARDTFLYVAWKTWYGRNSTGTV
jgi:hypothetical protein